MKNMKIVMAIFITLIFSIINVNAGTIKYNDTYLYNPDGETGEVEGIIFNENENIITFKNYNKDLSSELVMQDMGNIIINIDGENSFYGAIYSTGNLTINGINNGIFNVYTTGTIGSDNDLTINDLNIRIASGSYSTGLSGNNVIINNSSIKGVSYDSFGIVGAKNNIIINNSNLIDMGSSYHYGDLSFICSEGNINIKNNSTITINPYGYDKDYSFFNNNGFGIGDYHSYDEVWFDGKGIISKNIEVTDSNLNINGKKYCIETDSSFTATNSNINLQCYYGISAPNININSGSIIEKGAITGIQANTLKLTSGTVLSSVMDDNTKQSFINYMENDSNESRRALNDINGYYAYQVATFNIPDDYGVFVNGTLLGEDGNPNDIIPFISGSGLYVKRGDYKTVMNIYNTALQIEARIAELKEAQNPDQNEIKSLEKQLDDLEVECYSYLIEEDDVDPDDIVYDDINILEIKLKDKQVTEQIKNVPNTGIIIITSIIVGIMAILFGAMLIYKNYKKPVI